jgi:hypothetical protein
MKAGALAISAWMAVVVLNACPSAAAAVESACLPPEGKLPVVLLPARVDVYKVELFSSAQAEDWSAAARDNVDASLRDAVTQSEHLQGVELPKLATDERAAVEAFMAVAELVIAQSAGPVPEGVAQTDWDSIDRTLGLSLAFLRERTGTDCALGVIGLQAEQSKAAATIGTAASVVSTGLPGPALLLPPVTGSFLELFIVDLRTGEIRWWKRRKRLEIAGVDLSDLRDRESVDKATASILKRYPESPTRQGDKEPPAPPSNVLSEQSTSTPRRALSIRLPAGWQAHSDTDTATVTRAGEVDSVAATRDGDLLNRVTLEWRNRLQAFRPTGGRLSRSVSPEQLLALYETELQSRKYTDLQIDSRSVESKLVGRPAFRMRSSYRFPDWLGGVRVEMLTVGAVVPDGVVLVEFTAPRVGYFDKAMSALERSLETLELTPWR